jgi:hypothetical protein
MVKYYPNDAISRASALAEQIDKQRDSERRWRKLDHFVMPVTLTAGMVLVGVLASLSVLFRG